MNNIGTTTLRQPRLLYTSSITTQSSGTTTGSGTTNDDDGLQSAGTLAGTFILDRAHRNHSKQASNIGTTYKLAWHARSVHWMYLSAHKKTRSIQDKQQHGNYRLSRNYHEIIRITWHEQHEHNIARTIWSWHEHINLMILACNMMTLHAPFILLGLPRKQHMYHLPTSDITQSS